MLTARSHEYHFNKDLARRLQENVPCFKIHAHDKLKKMADENHSKVKQHLQRGVCFPPAVKHVLPCASAPGEHHSAYYNETDLVVMNADTTSAVRNCNTMGLVPVCAHNFACATCPGGGYLKGSTAQEEDLCRNHLNLYPSINHKSLYPIRPKEALLSKGIEVTRDPGTLSYVANGPIGTCDIATNALPNLNNRGMPKTHDRKWSWSHWTKEVTTEIWAFLYTAKQSGCPHVITGAFGCGAFKNPPERVAGIFAQVLAEEEFRGVFKTVIFAIVDTKGSRNLPSFTRQLKLLDPRHVGGVRRELVWSDQEPPRTAARTCPFPRPAQLQEAMPSASTPRALFVRPTQLETATVKKTGPCDKCDGPHFADDCPHFRTSRDDHKDATDAYGKNGVVSAHAARETVGGDWNCSCGNKNADINAECPKCHRERDTDEEDEKLERALRASSGAAAPTTVDTAVTGTSTSRDGNGRVQEITGDRAWLEWQRELLRAMNPPKR